jgi:hypothetical protein
MDMLRSGYHAKMQTWADGRFPPADVVWFRAEDDAPAYPGMNPFMSRNYLDEFEGRDSFDGLGEQRTPAECCPFKAVLPYYNGNPPAPYDGDHVCGGPHEWQFGGDARSEIIVTDTNGVAPCCNLDFVGEGGEVEGDPPVIIQRLVSQATPLWSAMQAQATIDTIALNTEMYLQLDTAQAGNTWDTSRYVAATEDDFLTIPYDGYYQFSATLYLQAFPSSSPLPWQEIWQTYLTINGVPFPAEFDLAVYVLNYVPAGSSPPDVIGASLNFTIGYQCNKGDIVRLAVFLQQGQGTDYAIDDGYLAVTMLAAATASEGPTGICNQMAQATVTATRQIACVINPTTCVCPEQELPRARAMTAEVLTTNRATFARARAMTAEATYHRGPIVAPGPLPRARVMQPGTQYRTAFPADEPRARVMTVGFHYIHAIDVDAPRARAMTSEVTYTPG